jgi:hypothetical protein
MSLIVNAWMMGAVTILRCVEHGMNSLSSGLDDRFSEVSRELFQKYRANAIFLLIR